LYVGLLPRLLKIAPSCAIMISSYELGKRFFANS
jgi:solute carrier family 25 protein 39/40